MLKRPSNRSTNVALLLIILAVVVSLKAAERHTLVINGESTEVPVIFVSGHPYVGLEALANTLNGSVSSSGAIVALFSLPASSANTHHLQQHRQRLRYLLQPKVPPPIQDFRGNF